MSEEKKIRIIDATLIITTLACLIPMVPGFIFWNQLPDMMARHFDLQGNANTAIVMFAVGLVFTIIGNYLPKAPASIINFPVSPSILDDQKKVDDVKKIGARRLGYFMVASGFLVMITAFTPIHSVGLYVGLGIFIAGIIVAVVTTWRQAKKA